MKEAEYLVLVNREHPWTRGEPEDLVAVDGGPVLLRSRAAEALNALMAELGDGWREITAVSGWRSRKEQQTIWDQALAEHGETFTGSYVARPGCSEHQTGLAIDLGERRAEVDFLCPEFPDTGICGRFRAAAAEFGFVLRYPAGKEAVTGIAHEPWHFRYVGVPHAARMAARGWTLEEYCAKRLGGAL